MDVFLLAFVCQLSTGGIDVFATRPSDCNRDAVAFEN